MDHLSPSTARELLGIKLSDAQQSRIRSLIQRSKRDELSRDQKSELEGYLQLGSLLTLMHSKARMALKPGARAKRRKTA